MRSQIFLTLFIAYSFSVEIKCDDIKELISNLQEIIQNQSSTFNEEIQFLKAENIAKELRIQTLEEKSQVQQEVIEKLSLENEIMKKQINETIVNVRAQGNQINNDEFNNIQSMFNDVIRILLQGTVPGNEYGSFTKNVLYKRGHFE